MECSQCEFKSALVDDPEDLQEWSLSLGSKLHKATRNTKLEELHFQVAFPSLPREFVVLVPPLWTTVLYGALVSTHSYAERSAVAFQGLIKLLVKRVRALTFPCGGTYPEARFLRSAFVDRG